MRGKGINLLDLTIKGLLQIVVISQKGLVVLLDAHHDRGSLGELVTSGIRPLANLLNLTLNLLNLLHYGSALEENGDVYGDAVNTAARMASLAKREQIVSTAATVNGLTGTRLPETRSLGRARVSGKLLPIEIVDVVWQEDTSGMTMVQSAIRMGDLAPAGAKLALRHRGKLIELTENSEPFMMGREVSNNLVVEADWVSRTHAQIEYKRGHFMITDRSTNATYVCIGQDPELRLHRDEVHLRKSGSISMGQAATANTHDLIHFNAE